MNRNGRAMRRSLVSLALSRNTAMLVAFEPAWDFFGVGFNDS